MPNVDPNVGATVPVAGVPNVEAPNAGSCGLVCPKLEPNPPKLVVAVDVGTAPNAVPNPVAVNYFVLYKVKNTFL